MAFALQVADVWRFEGNTAVPGSNVKAKGVIGKKQTEGHTCGLHCLEAIYEAHGVNPGKHDLRNRLGVGKAALPFAKDSTGRLQLDIYRVAFQDGFLPEALDLENPYCEEKLRYHLESGQLAMALFKKKDSGILHRVILSDLSQERLRIVDSLLCEALSKAVSRVFRKGGIERDYTFSSERPYSVENGSGSALGSG